MSYIDATVIDDGSIVKVWERDENDNLITKQYDAEYYCYVPDERGVHNTLFVDRFQKANRKDFKNQWELKEFVKKHNETSNLPLFESDIPPDLKVLSSFYYKNPVPKFHITFLDIEVDADLKNKGWPTIDNPYGDITSVSFYHQWKNEFVLITTPPPEYNEVLPTKEELGCDRLIYTSSEKELLGLLLLELQDSDILSGWNSDAFDIPYIIASLDVYYGKEESGAALCRDGLSAKKHIISNKFGKDTVTYQLVGRVNVDYMDVYKKYTFSELQSYSLESVADHELGYGKLDYKGTLPELYRNDYAKFLKYNMHDVVLLRDLDTKLSFMEIINRYGHDCCCRMHDVMGTVVGLDQALISFAHHELGKIVPDRGAELGIPEYISTVAKAGGTTDNYSGAFVYDMDTFDEHGNVIATKKGLHDYIGSMDVNSEYPNAMISNNISIETIKWNADRNAGDVVWANRMNYRREDIDRIQAEVDFVDKCNKTPAEYVLKRTYIKLNAEKSKNWEEVEKHESYTWGARNDVVGLVPQVLIGWFNDRLAQKAKVEEHFKAKKVVTDKYNLDIKKLPKKEEIKSVMNEEDFNLFIHHSDREKHFDRLQHITKIKLNSLYGCVGNAFSHFYNLAAAEACTLAGQGIVIHMAETVAEVISGKRDIRSDCIQYGDTDSVYFRIPKEITNDEDAVIYADYVAETVNDTFYEYMQRTHNCNDWQAKRIAAGREVVADKVLFTDKKRYAMHLIDKDGKPCDKLKIMGLEVIKSTTPVKIKKFLKELLTRMLTEKQTEKQLAEFIIAFRKEFNTKFTLDDFGEPKGVNGVEDYVNRLHLRELYDKSKIGANSFTGDPGLTPKQRNELLKAQEDAERWKKIIKGKTVTVPGHVRSSINWNNILDSLDDHITSRIVSGTKIKTYYLKKNKWKITSIAIPTDIVEVPTWFLELPFDMGKIETTLIDNKLEILYNSIGWSIPTMQQVAMNDLFGF